MTKETLRRRSLSVWLIIAVLMLLGTVSIIVAFGPSITNVLNLVVAVCNVVVFASIWRGAESRTG